MLASCSIPVLSVSCLEVGLNSRRQILYNPKIHSCTSLLQIPGWILVQTSLYQDPPGILVQAITREWYTKLYCVLACTRIPPGWSLVQTSTLDKVSLIGLQGN